MSNEFITFNRWKEDENIANTSNLLENAFDKTMSGSHKRKFKIIKGLMSRIRLNELKYEENKNRRKDYSKQNPT